MKQNSKKQRTITRRELLGGLFAIALMPACQKGGFERPNGMHLVGEPRHLLKPMQHISNASVMLFRDKDGWSAMSTRCTLKGCDLTVSSQQLYCSCCGSIYSYYGDVYRGPASKPLPYYKLRYGDDRLYTYSGASHVVDRSYRFTTPEIETIVAELKKKMKTEGAPPGVEIPEMLLGSGDPDKSDESEDKFKARLNYLGEEMPIEVESYRDRQRKRRKMNVSVIDLIK